MQQPNNLNLFKTLFLVYGILVLVFSLFPLIYVFLGGAFFALPEFNEIDNELPFNPGIIFIVIGLIGFAILIALGIVTIKASKHLGNTSNYNFVLVASILICFTGLMGMLLGIFSIIEINKPEVKQLFPSKGIEDSQDK